jgi:putative ferrous iron transport protein C
VDLRNQQGGSMNLLDIKKHLMQVKMASLAALSAYFKCETELLRRMLDHWVRKGQVRRFEQSMNCGGKCVQCGSCATEIYEWLVV